MVNTESTLRLVRKLIDRTSQGLMKWKAVPARYLISAGEGISYEGRDDIARFRLTREIRQLGLLESRPFDRLLGGNSMRRVEYRLELIEDEIKGSFTFPDVESMGELFQVVSRQALRVDDVIDRYLEED